MKDVDLFRPFYQGDSRSILCKSLISSFHPGFQKGFVAHGIRFRGHETLRVAVLGMLESATTIVEQEMEEAEMPREMAKEVIQRALRLQE